MPKPTEQPDRFFSEAKTCLAQLRGIPVIAIDALRNNEAKRDVIISILRTVCRICNEAGLDIEQEVIRQGTRETAQDSIKEIMSDDRLVSMEELNKKGLKLHFTDNGPVVVPV